MQILRFRPIVLAICLAACFAPANTRLFAQSSQVGAVSQDDLEAAFLYNFAKYVEWPPAAFPNGAMRLCVVADARFIKKVDDIIGNESIDGRPLTRPGGAITADNARTCHILFIARSEAARAGDLLAAVRGAQVLTVGESEDFIARGGMLTFVREGARVRFDINVTEARKSGLTVSARLLQVARRISSPQLTNVQ